jgi:hypothetical protein
MARAKGLGRTTKLQMSRMVLNQERLGDVVFIVADGFFEAGRVIVERASAHAPDYPYPTKRFPFGLGEGLPRQGGVLVYAGNKKTHGFSLRGDQPKKPRSVKESTAKHSVATVVGFGFPARFNELGTIRMPAHPFLGPARDAVGTQGVVNIVGSVTRPRLRGPR